MNIFVLSLNPYVCSLYHCDKHVVKMILEYAQILCTVHRLLDGECVVVVSGGRRLKRWVLDGDLEGVLYKSTHVNHPCVKWVLESSGNYEWLYELFCNLLEEYRIRYGRVHKSDGLRGVLGRVPGGMVVGGRTEFALAMPDEYKVEGDVVGSYRLFYKYSKVRFAVWKGGEVPWWM